MFCGKCKDKESACLSKTHADCGHPSIWHHSMPERMPECIHPTCVEKKSGNESSQKTTLEDFCAICWVEELSYSPCLKLNCGHIFHAECVKNKLKHRWTPGGAVSLSFLECPLCKAPIDWPATCQPYVNDLRGLQELRADLKLRSLQQLKIDNLEENLSTDEEQRFDYAMHKFNFYECFKCKSFYYVGRKECYRQAAAAAPVDGEQPVPDAVEGAEHLVPFMVRSKWLTNVDFVALLQASIVLDTLIFVQPATLNRGALSVRIITNLLLDNFLFVPVLTLVLLEFLILLTVRNTFCDVR